MTGDDELIDRLRRTLFTEADAITPRRDPYRPPSEVRPATNGGGRRHLGRLPWAMAAVAAVAAAIALAVIEWPSHQPGVRIGVVAPPPKRTIPVTTLAPSTTVPSPPTTLRSISTAPPPPPPPVPAGFQPSSVTFVSPYDGWAAGSYPCGSMLCVGVARTYDGGQTWRQAGSSPVVALPNAGIASVPLVANLRFAEPHDGWLYAGSGQNQQIWSTHDGGATWSRVSLPVSDATITSLETAGGTVYAAVLDMSDGTVHIESAPVEGDSWTDTRTPVGIGGGPVPSAQLVLQSGGTGWLIENDRTVVGGMRLSGGHWTPWTPPCSTENGTANLAATTPQNVDAVCQVGTMGAPTSGAPAGATYPSDWLYTSNDGGTSFKPVSRVPVQSGSLLSGGTPRVLVASGTLGPNGTAQEGLVASLNNGTSWRTVYQAPAQQAVLYLGFTTPTQGVAIVGGSGGTSLLMTRDAGVTWAPVNFS